MISRKLGLVGLPSSLADGDRRAMGMLLGPGRVLWGGWEMQSELPVRAIS